MIATLGRELALGLEARGLLLPAAFKAFRFSAFAGAILQGEQMTAVIFFFYRLPDCRGT